MALVTPISAAVVASSSMNEEYFGGVFLNQWLHFFGFLPELLMMALIWTKHH
jgi:hypothetical protein